MSSKNKKTDEVNWADFQKKYFDALMSFNSSSPFLNKSSLDNSFWNAAMDQWWNTLKTNSSADNDNVFEKIVEQSRNYYFLGEQFSNLIDGLSNFKDKKKGLTKFINEKFAELQAMMSKTPNQFNWNSFADAFQMPFSGMNNAQANQSFDFANMFDAINPNLKEMRNKFLSMPGVGYSRETQEKIQKLFKLGAIYQDNYAENQTVMAQLNQDALELMRKNILSMSKKGETINSMRQVYDLWVDANETVYADYAFTEEYSELNGRLVNSQMAFMKLSREVNEDILTAMNMPTNSALNELERRHYDLTKKVKALEAEMKVMKQPASKGQSVSKAEQSKPSVKKAIKKKVAKKKVSKKKTAKKKVSKRQTKKKSRSTKNDVIEIKF